MYILCYNKKMKKDILKPNELAKLLNVSVKTLQRWDNDGILKAYRTPTDRRYYTQEQYLEFIKNTRQEKDGNTVIYARVFRNRITDGLKKQVEFLQRYAKEEDIIVDDVYEEVGSGFNFDRKKWNELIDRCRNNEIKTIIIYSKDRFVKIGYDWFERFLNSLGVEIIVVK